MWNQNLSSKKTVKNISHFISSACKRWVRKALRYKRLYLSSDVSKSQGKSPNRQVSRSAKCLLACNSQLRYGCLGFDKTAFCRECRNFCTVSLWLHLWLFIEPSTWNWIIKLRDAADWKVVQCLIFLFSYSEINTRCHPNESTFCANLPANAASDLQNISNWKWTRRLQNKTIWATKAANFWPWWCLLNFYLNIGLFTCLRLYCPVLSQLGNLRS